MDASLPLSWELQTAVWPTRLAGVKLPVYRGSSDPKKFFIRYETAVESAGGGDAMKARALPVALEGIARTWYYRLPTVSIHSWGQLNKACRWISEELI